MSEVLNSIVNASIVDELSGGVDVEEEAVVAAADDCGVARPHLDVETGDVLPVAGHEEARQAAHLSELLLLEDPLDEGVAEHQDLLQILLVLPSLLIECERSRVAYRYLSRCPFNLRI